MIKCVLHLLCTQPMKHQVSVRKKKLCPHTSKDNRFFDCITNCTFRRKKLIIISEIVWRFIGVHTKDHFVAAWRYEFSLLVLKNISKLEKKFRIFVRPCMSTVKPSLTGALVIRSPRYYGHLFWPPGKTAIHFWKEPLLIRSPVNSY